MKSGWSVIRIGGRPGALFNCVKRGQVYFTVEENDQGWDLVPAPGLGSWKPGSPLPTRPPSAIRREIRAMVGQ